MNIKRPIRLFLFSIIIGIIILFGGIRLIDKLILVSVGLFLCLILLFNKKIKLSVFLVVIMVAVLSAARFYIEKSYYDSINLNIDALNNKKQHIVATIHSKGKSTNSNYFILDDVTIYDVKFDRMRCYYNDNIYIDTKIGNKINIEGYINKNQKPMNIGQFDSETYYRSLGETGTINATNILIIDDKYDLLRQNIYETREIIINQIFKIFNKRNAGLFTAMLVGDKSYIEKDQKDLFNENGIAHILAISGLHLSILGLCLFELLRKKLSFKTSAIIVSTFILLYAIFIDASITTLRAVVMLYLRFMAIGLGRSYDSKNVLFLTAIVFIIFRPYIIFNSGFQFSYVAVYALNLNYKYEFKHFVILRNKLLRIVDPNEMMSIKKIHVVPQVIVLTLFLLPITIYNYFEYPVYSVLLNLIVIPLMTFVLIFGILGLMVSFINIIFGRLLIGIVHFIFVFYEWLCNFINQLPYHSIRTGRPSLSSIILFYIILFVVHYVLNVYLYCRTHSSVENIVSNKIAEGADSIRQKVGAFIRQKVVTFIRPKVGAVSDRPYRELQYNKSIVEAFIRPKVGAKACRARINYIHIFIASIILISLSILYMTFHYINGLNIEMLYIGQGDSLIIRNNDVTITIDGGSTTSKSNGKYILEPNMFAKAIDKIDIAFITHSDADHTNCIEYLLSESDIDIGTLVLPIFAKTEAKYDRLKTLCDNKNVPIQFMKQYDDIKIDKDLSFVCLSPSEKYKEAKTNVNEQSLVLKMNYKGKTALFTGDIGKEIEEKLCLDKNISNLLKSDIYKVAHHGSKNSNTEIFIDKVSPEYAIVSYGIGNRYGHPNGKVIERLEDRNIKTLKTGESGEIDININNDKIDFETYVQ